MGAGRDGSNVPGWSTTQMLFDSSGQHSASQFIKIVQTWVNSPSYSQPPRSVARDAFRYRAKRDLFAHNQKKFLANDGDDEDLERDSDDENEG
ncbi:hypothetical protein HYALB_00008977 [Hymenoscyphus albidus]|uniref:Uncharacterized protein n=1 Tax=Hymenoscyphus albidus TaxID=595503 RepID=A0A9N9LUM8_9HELO|nr:hypothetical protein HYALB_00008977 [Hymenoscyphus albidus]